VTPGWICLRLRNGPDATTLIHMFACIYVPEFAVQASLLPETAETRMALRRSPIAILDGPVNLPRVLAINFAAHCAGIRTGMTKLQAEVCAGANLRKRSFVEEESAQTALLSCAAPFSPRVESTTPGAVLLDLAGTENLFRLHGRRQNSQEFQPWPHALQAITAKAADTGFYVRVAIAGNPDTAFLAARGFSTSKIISAGEEAQQLALLPIETLPLTDQMRETLNRWGIRTFQSLAALPEVAIVQRLGQDGLYLQKLARGAISRPLLTTDSEEEFSAIYEFEDPVETLESIFFILNRLLHELCSRLISIAQAASELRLTVGLNVRQLASLCRRDGREGQGARQESTAVIRSEPSGEANDLWEHEWKLPVPTQDKNLLFSLVRLHLEKTSFSAPVRFLRFEVVPVKPRLAQGNLFAPPSPEPEKLEATLERVRGVVGATDNAGIACVGSPHLLNTHKPDSFILTPLRIVEADSPTPRNSSQPKLHRHPAQRPGRGGLIREANQLSESKLMRLRGIPVFSARPESGSPTRAVFAWWGNLARWVRVEAARRNPEQSRGSLDLDLPANSKESAPTVALRIFRPALETTVELDDGKPRFVRLWSRHRRVLAASGPWSTSGHWWNALAWSREEWEVAVETPAGLGFYRIYRDRLRRQWFVEGVFD
jgi:protein ImuB